MASPTVSPTSGAHGAVALPPSDGPSARAPERAALKAERHQASGALAGLPTKNRPRSTTDQSSWHTQITQRLRTLYSGLRNIGLRLRAMASPVRSVPSARNEIIEQLDFATLIAALHVGVRNRVQAVFSLIEDGTVSPEHFFHEDSKSGDRRSVIDHVLELYGGDDRPDISRFSEQLHPLSKTEQLITDISDFRALLGACNSSSAHQNIRNEANSEKSIAHAARLFLERAAALPQENQPIALKAIEPLLDMALRLQEHDTSVYIKAFRNTLFDGFRTLANPEGRRFCHSYAVKFVEKLSPDDDAIQRMWDLLHGAALVAPADQQRAYIDAVNLIANLPAPDNGLMNWYGPKHPLHDCERALENLHDEAYGAAAVALLDVIRRQRPKLLSDVLRNVRLATKEVSKETNTPRFARLADKDKLALFQLMLEAIALEPEDAPDHRIAQARAFECETWGRKMLGFIPEDMRGRAHALLDEHSGPMVTFR